MTAERSIRDAGELRDAALALRRQLEGVFAPDTAAPGFPAVTPSGGHCAAVSLIAAEALGGELVSADVRGTSHWFNRIVTKRGSFDLDLTGDQFGYPALQIAEAERLYRDARARSLSDVNAETVARARVLAQRAGLTSVADSLRKLELSKSGTPTR